MEACIHQIGVQVQPASRPHPPPPSPKERGRRRIEQYYNDTKKAPGRRCIHNLGWSEAKPQVFACVEPFRGTALHGQKKAGDVLLSHAVTHAVPSTQKSLTSEFGMGSGVASSLISPARLKKAKSLWIKRPTLSFQRGGEGIKPNDH